MQNLGLCRALVVVHDVVGAHEYFDATTPAALGASFEAFKRQAGLKPAELDIDAACTLFMCTLFGIANQWLADPGSFDMAECAPRYVHSCIHMLSHSPWLMRAPLPAPIPESAPSPATAP